MAPPNHPSSLDAAATPIGVSRRQLLCGLGSLAASSLLAGCGGSVYQTVTGSPAAAPTPGRPSPKPTTLPPQPVPAGPVTPASLTITSTAAATLGPNFLGLAYEKQSLTTPLFSGSNANLIGLFQRLGPGVLRIGGASVDHHVWTPAGPGQTPGEISPTDVQALAAFLSATGWRCLYGVNLGGAATGATTPALAAAEVAYVSAQLGDALLGIELGNACETYGDPGSFFPGDWSVEAFESLWQQFRSAIVAATPAVSFAGPAAAADVYSWTLPFGEYITRDQLGLLTQQYTHGLSANASVEDLIAPDPALTTELLELHYGAQSIDVSFRIDACAAYDDGGAPGVSNAYASSLWAIDTALQSALGGASGVHFQAGGQQPATPILDNNGIVTGPAPIFYGLLLTSLAGSGPMLATQLSAASLNVTAYAIQTSAGMSVVVVNKDAAQNLNLALTLPQAISTATLMQLTQLSTGAGAPSLSALDGVTLQGATVLKDGIFAPALPYALAPSGAQLSCYVPALSAVLLQLA